MFRFFAIIMLSVLALPSFAHELTPTYFDLQPSIYNNVYQIEMSLFNRREDVRYYEIDVYDEEWNSIPFAARERILNLDYLDRINFEIYIREIDKDNVEYLCTTSKSVIGEVVSSGITSRICSRIE